jgi:succinoglycan biosynthesis transport protein ExoP
MELKMKELSPLTLHDYWEIAVRNKWLIVGAVVVSLGIAGTLCLVLPKSYRSSTLIMVEEQKIPADYVKGIVVGSIESRLTLIQQQVMSRTLLSQVIKDFTLYKDEVQREDIESAIEKIRKSVRVETVGAMGGRGSSVEAFSISFANENPMTAMKVTAKLASLFIEQNLRAREQLTQGTAEFLQQELQRGQVALETQEQAISEFKQTYMGELPQQVEANLRALDRMQLEMNQNTEDLTRLNDRRTTIENSINEYEATGFVNPSLAGGRGGGDPAIARLKELERNLSHLSAEYKDTYPDIILIKQEIESLKAQIEEMQGANAGDTPMVDPYLQGLKRQLYDLKLEVGYLQDRRRRLTAQMKLYERRVELAPTREQELMILLRDYNNMQNQYQSLLDKKLNARVAENMEKREKGEQFRVIDAANLPQKPETPDQLRILLIGLGLGCGLGFGAAFVKDQLNPTFRRPGEAETLLGLPLIGVIPDFETAFGGSTAYLMSSYPVPAGPKPDQVRPHWEDQKASNQIIKRVRKGLLPHWEKSPKGDGKPMNGRAGWDRFPPDLNLVSKWRPTSVVAEQFRVAATRLTLMAGDRKNTVVVVTSAVKGEGKSSTVVNLGYVLARDLGKSTLIIDCDLKRPVVHAYTGVTSEPGLAEFLHGDQPIDACIQRFEKLPLWILTAGGAETRPVELSKMHQLAKVLIDLRNRFEYIILDAPPILPLADMNVLAGLADLLALVVRAEATSRDVVQQALNSLRPASQCGIILTGLWAKGMPYYMREAYYGKLARVHSAGMG